MISPKLFLFIERVVAAEMDIVVQNGHVCLVTTGARWPSTLANDLSAQLTDDLKAEIVEVFVEGDFECHELAAFLTSEPPDTVARLWPELVVEARHPDAVGGSLAHDE
jgi:hypothetical protein